jgi:hypothetical protein
MKLELHGFSDRVSYICGSHESFPSSVARESVFCIAYNLGYLPGSNKQVITTPSSTLTSLKSAHKLIGPGGVLSVTAYRGHQGGVEEYEAVKDCMEELLEHQWNLTMYMQLHKPLSPVLMVGIRGLS